MKKFQRALALLLAALLILSAPALAAEAETPAEAEAAAFDAQEIAQDPTEESAQEPAEEAVPVQAAEAEAAEETPGEDVQAGEDPAASEPVVADADDAQPREISEEQDGGDILAEAAGELPRESVRACEEAQEAQDDPAEYAVTEEATLGGAADNDALFEGYAADVLGLESVAQNRRFMGLELLGITGRLYSALATRIQKVAAGQVTNTSFSLTPAELGATSVIPMTVDTARDNGALSTYLGMNFSLALNTLVSDFPYEMYWFDKTVSSTLTYHFKAVSGGVKLTGVDVKLRVCAEYAAGTYLLSTAKLNAVKRAASNARAIVNSYKSKTDEQKLRGYVTEICKRVTYNSAALSQRNYGNPWQIVWVFDGDAGTNVVCEGYAKALKYLCDLTSFSGGVHCYTLTGNVSVSGASDDSHMWNVVTLPGGGNWLVDATFTDGGYPGLVLSAPSKVLSAGRSYSFATAGRTLTYTYDSLSMSVFPAGVRTLATTTQSVSLGGTIRMVVGDKRTLKPTYSPAGASPQTLTWASSNSKVVSVSASGVIKAKKKGTARIAVRTANGKTAIVTVKVYKKAKVKKVTLSRKGTLYLRAGTSIKLSASYSPWNARSGFKWSSSKKAVAAVNGSGQVYARKKGKAVITVKAGGKKARVKVVVY